MSYGRAKAGKTKFGYSRDGNNVGGGSKNSGGAAAIRKTVHRGSSGARSAKAVVPRCSNSNGRSKLTSS